MLSKQV